MPDSKPNPSIKTSDNKVKDPSTPADNQVKDDESEEVNTLKTWRKQRPSHFRLKIKSFTSLIKFFKEEGLKNYESNEFEASGYKWKLLLYPEGDEERNGTDHISLYLKFVNPWRGIKALLNFFIYDQQNHKYLSIQDLGARLFDGPKKEYRGHSRLVCRNCFEKPSNGFLVEDSCEFGVEVLVLEGEGQGECFRTLTEQSKKVYVWRVKMLSDLRETNHFSQPFRAGDFQWKLHLCYNRSAKIEGKYLSTYLCLEPDPKRPPPRKMHVEFKLSVYDRVHENKSDKIAKTGNAWFSNSSSAWGFPNFINLADSRLKSLIVDNEMQIEMQIISMSWAIPMSN